MKQLVVILAFTLSLLPSLFAGFVYHMQITHHDVSPAQMSEGTISFQGDKLLIKMDKEVWLVYDASKQEVTAIEHNQKEYRVLNKETFESIAAQVNPMLEQMREQVEQLPPEQREAAEKMLKGKFPDQAAIKLPEVKKTLETATRNGYPCTRIELIEEGRKVSEVWVTDFDRVEGSEEAVRLFLDMGRFIKEMAGSMVPGMQMPGSPFD